MILGHVALGSDRFSYSLHGAWDCCRMQWGWGSPYLQIAAPAYSALLIARSQ